LTHKNETATEINRQILAAYAADTVDTSTVCNWVRESRDSDKNLDLNEQPQSDRPVTATHNLNKQKANKVIQENLRISQDSHSCKTEHWFH
jgi:hypothetical protein